MWFGFVFYVYLQLVDYCYLSIIIFRYKKMEKYKYQVIVLGDMLGFEDYNGE